MNAIQMSSRGTWRVTPTILTAAACLACAGTLHADTASELEALRAEVAQIRSELAQHREDTGQSWLDERRSEEIRGLVEEVLDDARSRPTFNDGLGSAGWDRGFFLKSADGNNLMRISGAIKPRHVYNFQSNPPSTDPDPSRGGFELTCSRFMFSGHVIDPSWKYIFVAKVGNSGNFTLLDASVTKSVTDELSITIGQFKLPVMIEDLISELRQQFVDRSMVSNALAGGYSQGVRANYHLEDWRFSLALSDGRKQINKSWNTINTDWAVTARVQWKAMGKWSDYNQFTGFRGTDPLLVIGLSGHVEDGEYGPKADPEVIATRQVNWSADALLRHDGWSLFASFSALHTNANNSTSSDTYGAVVQGGYFVTDEVELMARYEWGHTNAVDPNLNVLTVGANYYFKQHNAKITMDVGYAFTGVSSTWANTGLGWRADSQGEKGQVVIRTQFQLIF